MAFRGLQISILGSHLTKNPIEKVIHPSFFEIFSSLGGEEAANGRGRG
jgi:hypothetical protein